MNLEMKYKQIDRNLLEGYRRPTGREVSGIQRYLLPDLKKTRRLMRIGSILCSIAAVGMAAALFVRNSGSASKEAFVNVVLAAVFAAVVIVLEKRLTVNRTLTANIREGRFEVLDCLAYAGDASGDIVGGGEVKVHNMQGQYCRDRFTVDRESVKEYMDGADIPFLLMKSVCGRQNKEVFYELFSWRKLEG